MGNPRSSREGDDVNRTPAPSRGTHRTIAAFEGAVLTALRQLPPAPDSPYLVALSGGPDSVALLHALKRISVRHGDALIAAAHLNHRIRGGEADRDEAFARELCEKLEVELVVERAQGVSSPNLEERAREVRYEFLERAARSVHARFVLLAHHADDQAETAVLRLLRGTGIAGLAAMGSMVSRQAVTSTAEAEGGYPLTLVRPLLALTRDRIREYLQAIGADYVVDSSNLQDGALRNRIRHSLIAELERVYAPGFSRRLVELAREAGEVEAFLTAEAQQALELRELPPGEKPPGSRRIHLEGFALIQPVLANAILRELIRRTIGDLRHVGRVHIEAMRRVAIGDSPSAIAVLPRRWRFRREYQTAVLERSPFAAQEFSRGQDYELKLVPGENRIEGAGLRLQLDVIGRDDPGFPRPPWHPRDQFEAWFDAAEAGSIAARSCWAGDRVRPLGMCGSRKVHDVFVDRKLSVGWRIVWPLVVGDGEVLWIPGMVRSGLALVSAQSEKVLHLRANSAPGGRKLPLLGL